MDAVQRLLLLVAQRRGVVSIDLGMVSDVAMVFQPLGTEAARYPDRITVCESDIEGAADKLASEICGDAGASGRRP